MKHRLEEIMTEDNLISVVYYSNEGIKVCRYW